jgi:hypothetical protein
MSHYDDDSALPPSHLYYHHRHSVNTYHHSHAHFRKNKDQRWPQTSHFGRNAGPNNATVVWALGMFFFHSILVFTN